MLGQERNRSERASLFEKFLGDWQICFAFFIFLGSFLSLLFQWFFYIHASVFHIYFVSIGIFVEFLIILLFWLAYQKDKFNRSHFGRYIYLIYTAIGLPFTIYLSQIHGSHLVAFFRFVFIFTLLPSFIPQSTLKWHLSLLFFGLLFYKFLEDYHPFEKGEWTFAVVYLAAAGMLSYRESLIGNFQKSSFYTKLGKERWQKKHAKLRSLFERSLRSLSPPGNIQNLLEGKESLYQSGYHIVVGLFFPGVHNSIFDFQDDPAHSQTDALREFQREWDIFLHHLYKKLLSENTFFSSYSDRCLIAYPLEVQHTNGGDGFLFDSSQKKQIFQLFFNLMDILQFAGRTRLSIENRGYSGWHTLATMSIGECAIMQNSFDNPSLVFRGPFIEKWQDQMNSLLVHSQIPKNKLEDRLWIEALFHPLFGSYFEMQTALSYERWESPEFLLSEYTQDRAKLAPNQHFWEHL